MVSDITFLWFLLFSMCHSLHVAVNKCINWCINWCFVHLLVITPHVQRLATDKSSNTELQLLAHLVTSSVTWALDLAYVVSYWRDIVTMHLLILSFKPTLAATPRGEQGLWVADGLISPLWARCFALALVCFDEIFQHVYFLQHYFDINVWRMQSATNKKCF